MPDNEKKQHKAAYDREYRKANKAKRALQREDWLRRNPGYMRDYQSSYQRENRKKINTYLRNRRKVDPTFRITGSARARLSGLLRDRGIEKTAGLSKMLGYAADDLRRHLESKFLPGMSWANYGTAWQIDHIRPVASFVFQTTSDPSFRACWALSNLRPCWKEYNQRKGRKQDWAARAICVWD